MFKNISVTLRNSFQLDCNTIANQTPYYFWYKKCTCKAYGLILYWISSWYIECYFAYFYARKSFSACVSNRDYQGFCFFGRLIMLGVFICRHVFLSHCRNVVGFLHVLWSLCYTFTAQRITHKFFIAIA